MSEVRYADPTDPQSELDRKTYETVEQLVRQHEQGKLGPSELSQALHAVWNVVCGLASPDISLMVSQVCEQIRKEVRPITKVYRHIDHNGQVACVIQWVPGEDSILVLKGAGDTQTLKCVDEAAAKARFIVITAKLAQEYEELR